MRLKGSRCVETKALVDHDSLWIEGAHGVCCSASVCKFGHPGRLESLGPLRMVPLSGTDKCLSVARGS